MFSLIFLLLFSSSAQINQRQMLVRVYVEDYSLLKLIDDKSLDIAGRKYGEYWDIVVTPQDFGSVVSSGLPYEVVAENIEDLKDQVRGQYHSYDEVVTIMRNYASTYSSICKLDSIGRSYQNRWIYALKISDNPSYEDPDEPGILYDALHHSREWATIEVVLFYADTLCRGYNNDTAITNLINNNEIWLIPIVNPDGYVYDYPVKRSWRKTRKPFGGSTGTDANRNYGGYCMSDPFGDWGSVPEDASITHDPGYETFCGAYSGWSEEVAAMMNFHRTHEINANITYHSYAEEILWPWGHSGTILPPDNTAIVAMANQIASRMQRVNGGNYVAGGSLYPTTGSTDDWVYGHHHFIQGYPCFSYTVEVGTAFYQNAVNLDQIARENWKGALYFAQQAATIRQNYPSRVPSSALSSPDTATSSSCNFVWAPSYSVWNAPDKWLLEILSGYSFAQDGIESGTANWILSGFTQSTARKHTGTYSLYSGSQNNIANTAQTRYPYIVQPNDTFSFWCWNYSENNYDVTIVEISEDGLAWNQLDTRYTGSQQTWTQKKYSLAPWVGKAVYFRFRTVTDDNTLNENFYVDDISPVAHFSQIEVIDSVICDTSYVASGLPLGENYFRVRGHNTRGWGNYSNIAKTVIVQGSSVEEPIHGYSGNVSVFSNSRNIEIKYSFPSAQDLSVMIFDITGRQVGDYSYRNLSGDDRIQISPASEGVLFVHVNSGGARIKEKVLIIR